jgi:hypothetical protein
MRSYATVRQIEAKLREENRKLERKLRRKIPRDSAARTGCGAQQRDPGRMDTVDAARPVRLPRVDANRD